MQKKLLVAALGTLFAMPVLAADAPAAPAAPYTITSNVGITTDYTFRGISQNLRSPTIQGGFDFVHTNGVYLGTWASNVSGAQYNNASMEWDLYGGYNGTVNADLTYNVGLIDVIYPNGNTATNGTGKKYDTAEFQFGGTFKGVNVAYHYSLTNWFGISNETGGNGFDPLRIVNNVATTSTSDKANVGSKGSGYLEANYTYTFAGDVGLSFHAGHQKIRNFGALSYTDYKIGISKPVSGYTLGAAYTSTNASDNQLTHIAPGANIMATTANKNLRDGYLAVSVSRSF